MKRLATILAAAVLAGCGGPEYPPPSADRGQLVVKLAAAPKKGVHGPRGGSGDPYSMAGGSAETGRRYQRVDYDGLADIAVILEGKALGEGGPAPREARLTVGPDGPDHRLVLLGPRKHTKLVLANATNRTLTLGCMGPTNDGFLETVPAGAEKTVSLSDPGTYELGCDEDPGLAVTLLVAPTTWATTGVAGTEVFFDNVPPGDLAISVRAPRLPVAERAVTILAGRRFTASAECTVNHMDCVK